MNGGKIGLNNVYLFSRVSVL